eukprot:scaffold2009_cov156-Skeletonema_marinoi.AAC.6
MVDRTGERVTCQVKSLELSGAGSPLNSFRVYTGNWPDRLLSLKSIPVTTLSSQVIPYHWQWSTDTFIHPELFVQFCPFVLLYIASRLALSNLREFPPDNSDCITPTNN